jgi:hypothetical protein
MPHHRTTLLAALCALVLPSAYAQDASPLAHRSALEDYRPFAQEEVQPWKQTNDTVREAGGWKAYAREIAGAQEPSTGKPAGTPADAPKPAGTPPSADPHAGHTGHAKP